MTLLNKYWAPKFSEHLSSMRSFANGQGVCFDVKMKDVNGFLENFDYLKEKEGKRVDFICVVNEETSISQTLSKVQLIDKYISDMFIPGKWSSSESR